MPIGTEAWGQHKQRERATAASRAGLEAAVRTVMAVPSMVDMGNALLLRERVRKAADPPSVEVRTRRPCESCVAHGAPTGQVRRPEWDEYFGDEAQRDIEARLRTGGHHEAAADAYERWWAQRGYAVSVVDEGTFSAIHGMHPPVSSGWKALPPECEPCPDCEGEKVVQAWVPLSFLLAPVHEQIWRLNARTIGMSRLGSSDHPGGGAG